MKLMTRLIVLAIILFTFTGCFETKKEITLNPDGSGMVVYESKQTLDPAMSFSLNKGEKKKSSTAEEKAKKAVKNILENSDGVEVWEDVSYKVNDENKLVFKGTAYFKSFNELHIGGNLKSGKNVTLKQDDKGMLLTWEKEEDKKSAANFKKLTEQEIDEQVKKSQLEGKQFIAMMSVMLKGFKDEVIFHLPGQIDKINNVEKINENSASLTIDGDKILAVVEALLEDTDALRKAAEEGRDLQKDGPSDDYFNQKVFGNTGHSVIHVSGEMVPLFDYEKEVAAAKKAFPEMSKKLGLSTAEISKPVETSKYVELLANIKGKVKGKIHGESFELEKAYVQGGILHLRQGKDFFADQELLVFLFLKDGETMDGKKYNVTSNPSSKDPHVHIGYKIKGKDLPETEIFISKYAMTLEFGKQEGNLISGKIKIVLPDEAKSNLSGAFVAEVK
ncbi:MAG: hypothetical protein GQ569_14260 [Methylococcaceae bacterium]|nr:hypothetical protein [Methylococcaceae bacterium]